MNNHLNFNGVGYKYENSPDMLLENINIDFNFGWTGIIGENGSGKTTLLKLASRKLKPTIGHLQIKGISYYCDQRTDHKPEGFNDLLNSYDGYTFKILNLLEIDNEWFGRWDTLSHGERKRCQITTALFHKPDILIIDEPTNHIDNECKTVLINSLLKFEGIGIIVSHDRELLNNLCSKIISIKNRTCRSIIGNYSTYEEEREKVDKNILSEKETLNKQIKKLEKEAGKRKAKASVADKRISKRNISRKDHDAKSKIDGARLTGKDAVDGKKYAILKSRIDKLQLQKGELGSTAKRELGIKIRNSKSTKSNLLFLKSGNLKLSKDKKLNYPDLYIGRNIKIGFIGKNGSGKSSLIKRIETELKKGGISFACIPQEISSEESALLLKRTLKLKNEKKGKIFTIISRLNSDPKQLFTSEVPSPGEIRKLMLAHAILEKKELIIMDEPTNHMDLPSIESVETALKEYKGSLLLVSHDMEFLKSITTDLWKINEIGKLNYKLMT